METALQNIANLSRDEATNIEYRVHKDITNPQQFILYENWESKDKHAEQFDKPYIKDFAERVGDILAKPYQAYFAEEL